MDLLAFISSLEFVTILTIAVFMAISPGPDFFMISRNSFMYKKKAGVFAALGVSVALWIHIAYSIAGLAAVIAKSIVLFSIIKYIGAGYLIFIGIKTIVSKPQLGSDLIANHKKHGLSNFAAFKTGFITNALNPKTTIFFFSIFTQVIDTTTPLSVQITYGAIISIVHFIWFYCVAFFFSHPLVISKFQRYQKLIESIVGAALVLFGIKIALTRVTE